MTREKAQEITKDAKNLAEVLKDVATDIRILLSEIDDIDEYYNYYFENEYSDRLETLEEILNLADKLK